MIYSPHVGGRLLLAAMTSPWFWTMGWGGGAQPPMPGSTTANDVALWCGEFFGQSRA